MDWFKKLFHTLTIKDFIKRRCSLMEYYMKNNSFPKHLYINKKIHKFVKQKTKLCEVLNRLENVLTYKNIKTGKTFEWIWKSESVNMKNIFVMDKDKDDFKTVPITFFDYAMKNDKLPTYIRNCEDGQIYKFETNSGGGFDYWMNSAGYKGITTGEELHLDWYGEDSLMYDEIIVLEER